MRRVTFIADIPTPYMVATLAVLQRLCDLTVLFSSTNGTRGLGWSDLPMPDKCVVIGGRVVKSRIGFGPDRYPSPRLLQALYRARPEVILSCNYSWPSLYAAAYARLTGAGLVIYCDGTSKSEAATRLSAAQRLSRQLLARLSVAAAALSEASARRFVELGWPDDRVFKPLHTTTIERFHEVGRTRRYRDSGPMRLLFAGRLIARKRIDLLIRATHAARMRGADVELVLAGHGPLEQELRQLADSLAVPATWLGFVDQQSLPAVYGSVDAFAFPSVDEPFGMVVLEAAATGLPLLSAVRSGATDELVEGRGTGVVIDPEDTESFADAIAFLASQPAQRERMGRSAFELTLTRTPEAAAGEYLRAVECAARRG